MGNKTAGVVAMHIGGDRSFPVDTHVGRVSRRLGLTGKPDRLVAMKEEYERRGGQRSNLRYGYVVRS